MRQLAHWGANVVKIDALLDNAGGEQLGGARQVSDFQNLYRKKRAMTLNLKDERASRPSGGSPKGRRGGRELPRRRRARKPHRQETPVTRGFLRSRRCQGYRWPVGSLVVPFVTKAPPVPPVKRLLV